MGNRRYIEVALLGCLALALASACPSTGDDLDEDAVAGLLARGDGGGAPGERAGPATRVVVTVVEATGLPDLDPGPGVTDPYVVLAHEGFEHVSSVAQGSQSPVWGDSFAFAVVPGGTLQVTMMDEDTFGSDETIGIVSVPMPAVARGETQTLTLAFRDGEHGTLTLTVKGL